MQWSRISFDQLSKKELVEIYRFRGMIFILEQKRPCIDPDFSDLVAYHLLARNEEGTLVAYARIYLVETAIKIGRVAVLQSFRGKKVGRQLMEYALRVAREIYPSHPKIILSAQTYLEKFYHSFGFITQGAPYLADGIPHIEMTKENKTELV